jgi:hypothetical protein
MINPPCLVLSRAFALASSATQWGTGYCKPSPALGIKKRSDLGKYAGVIRIQPPNLARRQQRPVDQAAIERREGQRFEAQERLGASRKFGRLH